MEQNVSAETLKGQVIWFNSKKGYGFIGQGKGKADFYVHYSDIEGDGYRFLIDEQFVQFTPSKDEQGRPKALNVRPL